MPLIDSPTELTTSATDLVLALESILLAVWLWHSQSQDSWRRGLWCWVFGLMAAASGLGALAHGLALPKASRELLWQPLYLASGIFIALFLVGVVADLGQRALAQRLVPWSMALGTAFYAATALFNGVFVVFVVYEAVVLAGALVAYAFLALRHGAKGAPWLGLGVLFSLFGAGLQTSGLSWHFLLPFDHNGIFHLLQIPATALLGLGARQAITCPGRLPPNPS